MENTSTKMRVYHRYLGFFLAGIMAMYSISGIVLVFRDTPFLKNERHKVLSIGKGLIKEEIGKAIKIKNIKVVEENENSITFEQGTYNKKTGIADFRVKELPYFLNKLTTFHKTNTNQPLYYLNLFFGFSLMFFVISTFWMFSPITKIFKKGIYFTLAGLALALLLFFI